MVVAFTGNFDWMGRFNLLRNRRCNHYDKIFLYRNISVSCHLRDVAEAFLIFIRYLCEWRNFIYSNCLYEWMAISPYSVYRLHLDTGGLPPSLITCFHALRSSFKANVLMYQCDTLFRLLAVKVRRSARIQIKYALRYRDAALHNVIVITNDVWFFI